MKKPKDYSTIIFCAFRYALGRRTYIVSTVANFIRDNLQYIQTKDIKLMIKEIEEKNMTHSHRDMEYNELGDPCDINVWLGLQRRLKEEVSSREGQSR